ncbi:MAG: hypothetical protein B6D64_10430 [Bacteroidetes bacterium 4484_276]|nr:MAG: hypothetical protein B6D64_10430 [Bacteroidetes bacterium 4484_276]
MIFDLFAVFSKRKYSRNSFIRSYIRIKINDKVYDRLLWLFSKFGKEEVEIISDDLGFFSTQKYLQQELDDIKSGQAVFCSQEELDSKLDKQTEKYGNYI